MASPNTIAMNAKIPKPTPVPYMVGSPNMRKIRARVDHKLSRGNTRGKRREARKLVEVPRPQITVLREVPLPWYKKVMKWISSFVTLFGRKGRSVDAIRDPEGVGTKAL